MIQVEVQDAALQLPALVAKAQGGEQVVLTDHGMPVARVTSEARMITEADRSRALKAIEEIRLLAATLDLGPFDLEQFKADRNFGRR